MAVKTQKPITYTYQGKDQQGKLVSGELHSKSLTLAKIQLKKNGVQVDQIHIKRSYPFKSFPHKRINHLDITLFTRQLATLLQAGIPLLQGLTIIANGIEKPPMQQLVRALNIHLESGLSFADALAHYPRCFNSLFCALIQSGEQSGCLDNMLDRIALHLEKREQLKMKINKAMKYPLFVTIVACIVSMILMLKVVPIFQDLFRSFGAELPLFTQLVLNLSQWFQDYIWFICIVLIILPILCIHCYQRSHRLRAICARFSLKLPIFGNLVYKAIIARYSRSLATSYAAGVPLIIALEYTAAATNHVIYQNAVIKIRDDVASGQQLHLAMQDCKLFPNMVIQMVAVGEESGALDQMLDKVASHFEHEVDHAVDGLAALIEPLLMVVLAVLVGGLVVAMYLPIFKMGSVV